MDITTLDKGDAGPKAVQASPQTARKPLPASPVSASAPAGAVEQTGAAGTSVSLGAVKGLVDNVKSLPGDGVNVALVNRIKSEIAQGTFKPDMAKTVDGLMNSAVDLMNKPAAG